MRVRILCSFDSVAWLAYCALLLGVTAIAQVGTPNLQMQIVQSAPGSGDPEAVSQDDPGAEKELQTGTALTRKGKFGEAIPHLLTARGRVENEYAASFNLALCYVGTRQYGSAISVLDGLRKDGHGNADVENLLAQAYVGDGQSKLAYEALERAVSLTPTNERLYLFVGDACMVRRDYALGLKVAELGLKKVTNSARLHYQRALFLSLLDEFDQARRDFELARKLLPMSEISYLSAANEELYAGNPTEATRWAREGINKGFENPTLLTILGEALLRSGARAGEAEFVEAQAALEKAIAMRPGDADAQTSLGKLHLAAGRTADAIAHLEKARELDPGSPSVYASLAKAYQRQGHTQQAQEALAELAKLNKAQAEKISSAPGDRKVSYSVSGSDH